MLRRNIENKKVLVNCKQTCNKKLVGSFVYQVVQTQLQTKQDSVNLLVH